MEKSTVKNKISSQIKELEQKGFRFKPGRTFFIEIGIGQKRWGQLIRNEKPATLKELERISSFFEIPIFSLIENRKVNH